MKRWLIGWGSLAILALAAPSLIVLGMLLLLPGLILLAAPTVFSSSLVFAILRRYLPVPQGMVGNTTAAMLALLLGWLAAQPWAITEHRAFEQANLPEVLPASPLKLAGPIRLEIPNKAISPKGEAGSCSALCAALLDTSGVDSVTVAITGERAEAVPLTYRLKPRAGDRSPGAYPVKPEAILAELPQEPESTKGRDIHIRLADRKADQQALAASWALRLASHQILVAQPASPTAAMTIRVLQEPRHGKQVSISRVEIVDRTGKALLRRSLVVATALAAPLRFSGSGPMENFRIHLARETLTSAPPYPELKPVTELFLHTSLARPRVDDDAKPALLDRLAAAGNPALAMDDPDLSLATLWFPTIDWQRRIPRKELSVLARVLSDERFPVPKDLYEGYESRVAPELRAALGSRILKASTPAQTRARLARLLSKMPQGTFVTLSSDEKAFLASSELRPDVYPMIVRIADQGEAAVPHLLQILHHDSTVHPQARRIWVMRALSLAFAALGPQARSALHEVDPLVNAPNSPLLHNWNDRKRWYMALARMGKPIEELQWPNSNPKSVARDRANLRRLVERFDPERLWDY